MDLVGEFPWDIKTLTAAELGWEPTDFQLKYWRENNVIRFLGDVAHPSGHGRVGLYAPGTAKLIVRLHGLLSPKSDLGSATWTLWIEGYPIDDRWTRLRLMKVAEWYDAKVLEIKAKAFEGPDQASFSDEFLKSLNENQRFYNKRLRLVRKLVGSKRLLTFLFYMLRLAFGHKIPRLPTQGSMGHSSDEISDEQDVVVAGLGFKRMLVDRVPGMRPATKDEIITPLDKVANALGQGPLLAQIGSATNEKLLTAAKEINAIRSNNRFLYNSISWLFGIHAFGRGHAARMFDEYSNSDDVLFTALWVSTRKEFLPELALEMRLHEEKSIETLHSLSEQTKQAAQNNPGLRQSILNKIRGKR